MITAMKVKTMNLKPLSKALIGLATLTGMLTLVACNNKQSTEPTAETFNKGMQAYLAQKGHLCLAKYTWPVEVTQAEFAIGGRNALQMPVLQKLGLVSASDVTIKYAGEDKSGVLPGKRYSLTPEGQKYFLKQDMISQTSDGSKVTHHGDFCAATLSLNQIVGWEPPRDDNGRKTTAVTYTYKIDAAPWARDPEAQRVFPMVARLIAGDGQMQLKEAFTLTDKGWIANDLM